VETLYDSGFCTVDINTETGLEQPQMQKNLQNTRDIIFLTIHKKQWCRIDNGVGLCDTTEETKCVTVPT